MFAELSVKDRGTDCCKWTALLVVARQNSRKAPGPLYDMYNIRFATGTVVYAVLNSSSTLLCAAFHSDICGISGYKNTVSKQN